MIHTIYLQLVSKGTGRVELRFWDDNPLTPDSRVVSLDGIQDLVDASDRDYYTKLPADHHTIGRQLFRWLDNAEDRLLSRRVESVPPDSEAAVLALHVDTGEQKLAHLPWELLHDGEHFLVARPGAPVLPIRWRPVQSTNSVTAENRALSVLYMATSPEGTKELSFEEEEARILEATKQQPISLQVEESGNLEELETLVKSYKDRHFDVFHLTGHATTSDEKGPVFVTESETGTALESTPSQLGKALPRKPPLLFLSGCRTGQTADSGTVASFAEEMLKQGFPAVLGWGQPVRDSDASLAAASLYGELASGICLPVAVVRTIQRLMEAQARDWHLLRFFLSADKSGLASPGLVSPLRTPNRGLPLQKSGTTRFLDENESIRVPSREAFVGRRRPLQRCLRVLKDPVSENSQYGVVIHGMGGLGKSSLASRLLDRRLAEVDHLVITGRLDEVTLIRSITDLLAESPELREILQGPDELKFRLINVLRKRQASGARQILIVLDDFEQNMPLDDSNSPLLSMEAAEVLAALESALREVPGSARLLITCRYVLGEKRSNAYLHEELLPMKGAELTKKVQRLDGGKTGSTNQDKESAELKARAIEISDGNPRLLEWLFLALEESGLDHEALLNAMGEKEIQFRENILARELVASLSSEARQILALLSIYQVPVPIPAIQALEPSLDEGTVKSSLDRSIDLGLVEQHTSPSFEESDFCYRLPRILEVELAEDLPAESKKVPAAAAQSLFQRWWPEAAVSDSLSVEMIRLAVVGGDGDVAGEVIWDLETRWNRDHRYRELDALCEGIMSVSPEDYRVCFARGRAGEVLGYGSQSFEWIETAAQNCPDTDEKRLCDVLFHRASLRHSRGDLEDAQSDLERILPILERLGDIRSAAVTRGKIADILQARGQLDEALKIRTEELLPVFERLGDIREAALTRGKIADILQARGQLDEALKIRTEEELPVFERLGDIRSAALTRGKIADILQARGQLDEALKIRTKEQLPVFERLGDIREAAVTRGKIADILQARGQLDEALKIRTEEQLPVFERLGGIRSAAVTRGKIADILQARGQLDEALKIRTEEQLPVFERLGDIREAAVTRGKIADILQARGQLDEALKIRTEEELPVYERLGDIRSAAVCRTNTALLMMEMEPSEEQKTQIVDLLVKSWVQSRQRGFAIAEQIESIMRQIGLGDLVDGLIRKMEEEE